MIQAMPPLPVYHCVKAADATFAKAKALLTVSGDPTQIEEWLAEINKHQVWKIVADATSNGVRFMRLEGPIEVPYREIGGLIYQGQVRHLAIAMSTEPPICEFEG